jgi:hypothetical protein
MNLDEEFYIRELTRKLNEQINSIRRELDNLKKAGLLKSKTKNRKKYYYVNKDFIIIDELKGIIVKALSSNEKLAKDIAKMGEVKLLAFSGIFINKETNTVDMLIVGNVDKEKLTEYINSDIKLKRPIKFSIMTEADYKYRVDCHDQFITSIIKDPENQIPIKKI